MTEDRVYVIAAWSGHRRASDPPYEADSTDYLRLQVRALQTHSHRLDRVVVMAPYNPEAKEDFARYLEEIPRLDVGCPIEVHSRPNVGLSYGSWSDAYRLFRGKFRWWFLFEDDMVPCRDGWDGEMVKYLEEHPDVCFLGSIVRKEPKPHIGLGWGLAPLDTLERTYYTYGDLPHDRSFHVGNSRSAYAEGEIMGNVGMYVGFTRTTKKRLADLSDRYRIGYIWPDGSLVWENPSVPEEFIVKPAQLYRDPGAAARLLRTDFSPAAVAAVRARS